MRTSRPIEISAAPLALVAVLLWLGSTATACPFCNGGPTGVNEIKAGIFNDLFWPRAAAVLAPFPVLLGLVALIYYWPQRWSPPRQQS